MFRVHVCIGKCNVRHRGNGIVTRLPTASVHAVDHLLHEHTQFARLSAFSLSTPLPADADCFWFARGHSLGKLAKPVRIAPELLLPLFRFQLPK